ncbi:anti-sigma factor family protein [Spirillospora sp. CA-294931]|uniref:anti-sigma factor family protein n=1 Tax=Spirillospora sp. CA-294931 TaxID=3240042 RepID=UPI003D8CA5E4
MSAAIQHTDVGAYALGLLEEPDRRAFEHHLAACPDCHRELGALRGLAATLDGLPPIHEDTGTPPVPDPTVVTSLLSRRAAIDRRRRTARAMLGAAAGIVLMCGAAGAGFTLAADRADPPGVGSRTGPEAGVKAAHRVSGDDPGTGVAGTVGMEPKAWGSRVGLELSRVRGPLECQLVAIDRKGRPHAVAGWSVPAKGYGQPGSPAPLAIQGATALRPAEIVRFEVRAIGDDRTLLTLPT